jgi:deoxyribose-phosphate aldolase
MIERFLSQVATNMVTVTSGHTIDKLTLKDLLVASPDAQLFKTSFGFVSVEATLADAKQVMDKIPKCNDVFVTATGKATEPLVGWITDNVISENATV